MSAVRQTSCRHCGQDIEGIFPYRRGEWRDRGNNTHCPTPEGDAGREHAPYIQAQPRAPLLFWPCTTDPKTGRISVRESAAPMTRADAEAFLASRFPDAWRRAEAIPQPVGHHYFRNVD